MTTRKNEAGNLLPKVFTFNPSNAPIRVRIINQEPYFVAKDVCDALSISNSRDAIARLDEDEKAMSVLPTQFGDKEMNLVNESGLYNLIFQSRKPEAKSFRKWVTSEVLPAIRKTGAYAMADSNYSKASQWRHRNGLLPQKRREDENFLDLRSTPYEKILFLGEPVRMVVFEDEEYYSVIDIKKALKITTDTGAMVRNLNVKEPLARKVFVFGATNPGWFCTSDGFNLLTCGRTSTPYCPKKVLAVKGGVQ